LTRKESSCPKLRAYRELNWKSASIRSFQNQAFPEYFDEATSRLLELFHGGNLWMLVDPTPLLGLDHVADVVEHLLAGQNIG